MRNEQRRHGLGLLAAFAFTLLLMLSVLAACDASSSRFSEGDSSTSQLLSSSVAVDASQSASAPASSTTSSSATSASGSAASTVTSSFFSLAEIPPYAGEPSVEVHGNEPFFQQADLGRGAFEEYAPLDTLGRCGAAFALVGRETLPTQTRESIGMVQPSGWQTVRYDWIDGKYLFNRCHLIGYQLTGQNSNTRNLITGTRSLNTLGMLPLEDRVAAYVERTGNHVLYRSTPVFEGNELVARGVLLEALSVEDNGAGVRFCMWCYNAEPGVEIDYTTGESHAAEEAPSDGGAVTAGEAPATAENANLPDEVPHATEPQPAPEPEPVPTKEPTSSEEVAVPTTEPEPVAANVHAYVLNTNTHKFHHPDCSSVRDMADHNKEFVESTRDDIIASGYSPCGRCNP